MKQETASASAPQGNRGRRRLSGRLERIYTTLRTRICLLDYPPGMRLREEDIADEFDVSRTPIRRVLGRLEDEGLLRSVHGVGTIVTDIDIDELEQVYQLRVEMAELLGKLSPLQPDAAALAEFRSLLVRAEALLTKPDAREFTRINMEFSHLLLGVTGNGPLRDFSERLYYETTRIWLKTASRLSRYEEMLATEMTIFHREIADTVAAIETGSLETVGHIRRAHVAMSFARLHAQAHAGDQSP